MTLPRYRVRLTHGGAVEFLTERGARTRAALESARHPRYPAPPVEYLDSTDGWRALPVDPPGDPYPDPGSPYSERSPYTDGE